MQRRFLALPLFLLLVSCAASEDGSSKSQTPVAAPPTPAVAASVDAASARAAVVPSIASVQMIQDCPDVETELAARAAKSKRKADSASGALVQPCSQSSLQLAFIGQGAPAAKVQVQNIRLLTAEGKELAPLSARLPTIWRDGAYVEWDELLAGATDAKVSYKLSVPDFEAIEKLLGGSSFGPMYIVELEVLVDGVATTLRSPQFERGRPEIIKT